LPIASQLFAPGDKSPAIGRVESDTGVEL
jgi:hypothetical protein